MFKRPIIHFPLFALSARGSKYSNAANSDYGWQRSTTLWSFSVFDFDKAIGSKVIVHATAHGSRVSRLTNYLPVEAENAPLAGCL